MSVRSDAKWCMEDKMAPFMGWFKGSLPHQRRKVERQDTPGVVAHYWDGGAPAGHTIRDLSESGLYVVTEQRWYPGTMVMMTLQRKDSFDGEADRSITVQSKVVRSGTDGVALIFVPEENGYKHAANGASNGNGHFATAGRKAISRFLQQIRNGRGQSLVEFVLILPVVLILIVNVVNFGAFFYAWITVSNAARAGADFAILSGASAGSLATSTANPALITQLITNDILSLPNRASLVVNICQNDVGATPAVTTLAGTCSGIPSDPEPTNYVLLTVDVTYIYQPLIRAGFQFSGLNVFATIPSTTIHRRAVMRELR
jgi:Flp pilus assembly protein TadG